MYKQINKDNGGNRIHFTILNNFCDRVCNNNKIIAYIEQVPTGNLLQSETHTTEILAVLRLID